jgi:hypothetical protein
LNPPGDDFRRRSAALRGGKCASLVFTALSAWVVSLKARARSGVGGQLDAARLGEVNFPQTSGGEDRLPARPPAAKGAGAAGGNALDAGEAESVMLG